MGVEAKVTTIRRSPNAKGRTPSAGKLALVLSAAAFAANKHKTQRRKDAESSPYINHPLELARILSEEGGVEDAEVIAAALLHDTIEDTETSYQELRGQFGARVADIVAEVTDTKWLQKGSRKRLQISKAAKSTEGARLVKMLTRLRTCATSSARRWRTGRWSASASISIGRSRGSTACAARTCDWTVVLTLCTGSGRDARAESEARPRPLRPSGVVDSRSHCFRKRKQIVETIADHAFRNIKTQVLILVHGDVAKSDHPSESFTELIGEEAAALQQ